jgi:aminoglycoside phosphotransferase family enzyme/predicted kinase
VNTAHPASSLDSPAAQATFVAAMQTPAAYAAVHAVDTPVRLIETHVSWLFLTGRFAYKVKKPLRLSFVDYSTPELRAAFCNEELRLNRRHAPGLYVDVVPIGGSPAAPRVGARDHAFEHALRMRQFDPDQELTRLLEHEDASPDEIAGFAADIARMHFEAARADPQGVHGRPERVQRVTLDNFDELRRVCAPPNADTSIDARACGWDTADLADAQHHVEAAFARVRALMERRRRDGHVRECHGDLHCGNVVRWQGRLVAFDGVEFDPALRFIDVASDLAFLTMDLFVHGRPDLRRAALDAWTQASGDYVAVELLPYYEAYRALVRAKVAALRDRQAPGAHARDTDVTRRYLQATQQQASRRAPWLIVMVGLSGSGKTWLARQLGAACGALHLRSDVERKRLAGLGPLDDSRSPPDGGLYTRDFGERTYARLRECAGACLRGGESVVVDAANLRRRERAAFVRLARDADAGVRLVHCTASLATLKSRITARRSTEADASEATVELLDRQPSYWEPFDAVELPLVRVADTTDDRDVRHVIDEFTEMCGR